MCSRMEGRDEKRRSRSPGHDSDVRELIHVIACSTAERSKPSQLEPISITDVSSVAGMWEGVLAQSPPSRRDDWVRLKIQEDGAYHFEAVRTIGVFSGTGTFRLENGKLIARIE